MSRYDSRASDPGSYRDRRSDGGFSGGGTPNFSRGGGAGFDSVRSSSSSRKDSESFGASLPKQDFDDLIPFEKNFYVECPSVVSMTEADVEAYRPQTHQGFPRVPSLTNLNKPSDCFLSMFVVDFEE